MTAQPTTQIDEQAIGAAVTTERLRLCDFLDTLAPGDWAAQSLCTDWTVHDVVAHLTLTTRDTMWDLVKGVVRARGSFDRMTTDTARRHAALFPPLALIQQLRDTAASTRRTPLSSPVDPLLDALVHAQDIARPLQRPYPTSPEHAPAALTHAVTSRWYGGRKRFDDVALIATDADWAFGSGSHEVRGPAGDLLMVATGRRAGLAALSGPGVDVVVARLG